MPDLKCTITITGNKNDGNVSIAVDFDPASKEDGPYKRSGVGFVADKLLAAIEGIVGHGEHGVEV